MGEHSCICTAWSLNLLEWQTTPIILVILRKNHILGEQRSKQNPSVWDISLAMHARYLSASFRQRNHKVLCTTHFLYMEVPIYCFSGHSTQILRIREVLPDFCCAATYILPHSKSFCFLVPLFYNLKLRNNKRKDLSFSMRKWCKKSTSLFQKCSHSNIC